MPSLASLCQHTISAMIANDCCVARRSALLFIPYARDRLLVHLDESHAPLAKQKGSLERWPITHTYTHERAACVVHGCVSGVWLPLPNALDSVPFLRKETDLVLITRFEA